MDVAPSSPVSQPSAASTIFWLAACVVTTIAISLAAAHAPPRIRLIGLYSIAFGLLIGWLSIWLAAMFDVRPSISLCAAVAGGLSLCGLVGSTVETWRLDESQNRGTAKNLLAERMIEQMKSEPNSAATVPVDTSPTSGFRWYLSRRIRQLGHWPSPWPELIWSLELVLGTIASVGTALRFRTQLPQIEITQSMNATTP
jgi:MFS family permease